MVPHFRWCVLLFLCLGVGCVLSDTKTGPAEEAAGRSRREQPGVTGWKFPTGDLQKLDDIVHTSDKVHVVSSSLRILPRKKEVGRNRNRRSEDDVTQWKKPRRHQFVTTSRMGKYLDPDPLRYYPEDRHPYSYRQDYPRRSPPHRRIIYYATLPEIVRPPVDWDTRSALSPGYPPVHENEVVTRVQSPVIDVSNTEKYKIQGAYSSPKITIIDVEPPHQQHHYPNHHYRYHRQPVYPHPDRHDFYRPPPPFFYRRQPQYSSGPPPYHQTHRDHLPPRHIIIPPLPNGVTVVRRKPVQDTSRDYTTTAPTQHDYTTTTQPATTLSYDRHYKY